MSEPQNDTDAGPTPGPWEVIAYDRPGHAGKDYTVDTNGWDCRVADIEHSREIGAANARLIAAAGTAAQGAKEMGYDPVAVQKSLPKILSAAEELLGRVEDDCRGRNINPYDEPSFTALEYALASAEGSEDE